MDYSITEKLEGDILILTTQGRLTKKNAHAIMGDVMKMLAETPTGKLLYDIRQLEGRLSLGSTYLLMGDLPSQRPRNIKVAIVVSETYRKHDEFFETTAANAGVYFRLFYDYDEALKWLKEAPQE
jgi:hypothetical protein